MGSPRVISRLCVKQVSPIIVCMIKLKKMVGVNMGSVIRKKRRTAVAPSILADSYNDIGICLSPDKKFSIDDPNCHTDKIIKVQIAVSVLPIQDLSRLVPNIALINELSKPSPENI